MVPDLIENEIIPHSRPTVGEKEAEQVARVIRSGQIAQGEEVRRFEQRFTDFLGKDGFQAVAVNSGTAALHLSLITLGVGPGDEVIMPSYVCSALLNAVRYVGARPVFADIDYATCNLDPADVRRKITLKTKTIIAPHMFGLSCEMDEISSLDIPVIEDCAQSVGTTIDGRQTGTFGDISIFSFYATKVMATGEGGMVVSPSPEIMDRIRGLREYDNREDDEKRYNYKMTDMSAAMGIVQLKRLDGFLRARNEIAAMYDEFFSNMGIRIPTKNEGRIYFRYLIEIADGLADLIGQFHGQGIRCARPVFQPLHRYFSMSGFPETEKAYARYLSLPIYPSLDKKSLDRILGAAKKICSGGNYD